MVENVQSLNVAVAGGILIYEAYRRRTAGMFKEK
jgi:tRNA G18 (ribose-2'-O)-methylase SpoU